MEKLLSVTIIFTISSVIGVICLVGYATVKQSKSPTFTLIKDQWQCTETVSYDTTTNVLVGKVIIPQTQRNTECINYQRIR